MKKTKNMFYRKNIVHILLMCFLSLMINSSIFAVNINIDNDKNHSITIENSNNNVPVVNINKPDSNGVSHNHFKDYNVGKNGVILNNGKNINKSELAGQIKGNLNLKNSQEAKKIITEVTGTNISKIEGFTEIVGGQADYILANPNGVYLNKAGFINTPNVTITTGKTGYMNGKFTTIDVEKGQVEIGNDGVDARNLTKFDIISRTAKLGGKIYGGKEVSLILGKNSYNVESGEVTSLGGSNEEGGLSLDANALGSIYAGKIYLKSTDSGVGVNSKGDMLADTDDLTIDVNGDLILKNIAGKRKITIDSKNYTSDGSNLSEGNIKISTNTLSVAQNSNIKGKNINIKAKKVTNNGEILTIDTTEIKTEVLENNNKVRGDKVIISFEYFDKRFTFNVANDERTFINRGDIIGNVVNIETNKVENQGRVTAKNIKMNSLFDNYGEILTVDMEMIGDTLVNYGAIYSSNSFDLNYNKIANYGKIISKKDGRLKYANLINLNSGIIYTYNNLRFDYDSYEVMNDNRGILAYGNESSIFTEGSGMISLAMTSTGEIFDNVAVFIDPSTVGNVGIDYFSYEETYNSNMLILENIIKVPKNTEVPNFTYAKYVEEESGGTFEEKIDYLALCNDFYNLNLSEEDFEKELNEEEQLVANKETESEEIEENDDEESDEVMRELLANGKEWATSMGILQGTPLTEEQIFNLEKDILWYEKSLENGVMVTRGKIYLSQRTIDEIAKREGKNKFAKVLSQYSKKINDVSSKSRVNNGIKSNFTKEDKKEEKVASNSPNIKQENIVTNHFLPLGNKKFKVEVFSTEKDRKIVVKEDKNTSLLEEKLNYTKTNTEFLRYSPEGERKEEGSLLEVGTVNGIIDSLSSLSE